MARGNVTSREPFAGWTWQQWIRRAPRLSTASCSAGRRRTYRSGRRGRIRWLRLDADEVCALTELGLERCQQGIPPHRSSYMSVEDANVTVARRGRYGTRRCIRRLRRRPDGGHSEPGRRRVCDLAAWSARAGPTILVVTWNELQTRDPEAAIDFYSGLFDWEMEPIEEGGKLAYVVIKNAGSSNGGIMPMTEQHGDAPSHWLAYFTVTSCEEAVARLRELGGGMLAGLLDLPAGRIAVVHDPQGGVFALFEGETDD
jgi:predicted enzyme related to lactoylglutathione lyase